MAKNYDMLMTKYTTLEDSEQVSSKVYQLQGLYEKYKAPRSML